MAESTRSSHDTSDVAKKRISPGSRSKARRDGDVKKMRDLDPLLAVFDDHFPGFTSAVLDRMQRKTSHFGAYDGQPTDPWHSCA